MTSLRKETWYVAFLPSIIEKSQDVSFYLDIDIISICDSSAAAWLYSHHKN